MPKVSVNILTRNRPSALRQALMSVRQQKFKDLEIVLISDGSVDLGSDEKIEREMSQAELNINFVVHYQSNGITASRQEALEKSNGEYVAILDDDDEWIDNDKLSKQCNYLDNHPECVLVGGCIKTSQSGNKKTRITTDSSIRRTMLLRNNFFTSTVMFRRAAALKVGGFIKDDIDLAEDYDLWLRLGEVGQMHNFPEVFTRYRLPEYNKGKFRQFLMKQRRLIHQHRHNYPYYWLAAKLLAVRLMT